MPLRRPGWPMTVSHGTETIAGLADISNRERTTCLHDKQARMLVNRISATQSFPRNPIEPPNSRSDCGLPGVSVASNSSAWGALSGTCVRLVPARSRYSVAVVIEP